MKNKKNKLNDFKKDNEIKSKKNKKKIITSIFMFSSLIASIVSVSVVSIIYSSKQTKKLTFIYDNENDTKTTIEDIENNKTKYTFQFQKTIDANELFNLDSSLQINKQLYDYGIKSMPTFIFYSTGYNFYDFFNKNNEYIKSVVPNKNDQNIFNINVNEKLNEFNKTLKKDRVNFIYFLKQITSLRLPLTYFFKNNKNEWHFFESKKDIIAFEIKDLFSIIHKTLNSNNSIKKTDNNVFRIESLANIENGIIKSISFNILISFETTKKDN
ncbi:hypothetical protein [Metamycoplasma canadense]|nr:hypothetical protein [Metamycoplasma canadense]